jgi:NAD(P)-dependent dehydrogenase (short-subunit alcohol dehydrogenase family)/drug/metabolite transporter (DMT)-like permease
LPGSPFNSPRLLFWGPTLIWASTWHVILYPLAEMPAINAVAWRFALASMLLFMIAARRGESWRLPLRLQPWRVLTGVVQFGLNYWGVYEAERYVPTGLVAVLYSLMVFGNAASGAWFFGQPITPRFVASAVAGVTGVALIFWPEVLAAGLSGMGWLVGHTFTWWGTLVYLAAVGSVLAFLLYFRRLQRDGPARAALTGVLVPVIALAGPARRGPCTTSAGSFVRPACATANAAATSARAGRKLRAAHLAWAGSSSAAPKAGVSMDLSKKVAVITGGGSGIGRAVAAALARRNVAGVALVDMNETVEGVAEALNAEAGRSFAVPFMGNVTDEQFRASVFDAISSQYGQVSLCVPAAGITRDDLAVRVDKLTGKARIYPLEQFKLVLDVNLIAPVYWALEMIGRIAEDRAARGLKRWTPDEGMRGSVVFIGSISSQGNRGQISYASTKAGLEGAAATIMKEAMYYGIRCSVIHPGFTDTPMVRAMGMDYVAKNILPFTQLGRLIQPDEIADAICFMLANSAVSGELWVDAGWHAPA